MRVWLHDPKFVRVSERERAILLEQILPTQIGEQTHQSGDTLLSFSSKPFTFRSFPSTLRSRYFHMSSLPFTNVLKGPPPDRSNSTLLSSLLASTGIPLTHPLTSRPTTMIHPQTTDPTNMIPPSTPLMMTPSETPSSDPRPKLTPHKFPLKGSNCPPHPADQTGAL